MSGHQGPSLTLLQRAFPGFRLDARLRLRGTVRLLMDYDGVLGPNRPESDATLHPLTLSRCDAVELNEQEWKLIRFGQSGEQTVLASGQKVGQASRLSGGRLAFDSSDVRSTSLRGRARTLPYSQRQSRLQWNASPAVRRAYP